MYLKKTSRILLGISLLTIFLMIGQRAFSQSRLSMSVDVAPTYELFRPTQNIPDNLSQNYAGVRVGASLHFRLATQWSLSSGLWLDWKYAKEESNFNARQHSFQIPLLVNYQVRTKRLAPYLSAGLLLDKPKYSVFTNPGVGERITVLDVKTKLQLKYVVGAGVRYKLNEQLVGIVQPMFTFGSQGDQKSSQLSLQTQLVFQF